MVFVNVFAFSVELAHEIARGYGKSDETVLAGILDRLRPDCGAFCGKFLN